MSLMATERGGHVEQVVRVGVIGTGVGVAHIEALQRVDGAAVTAVCSARHERAAEVARRYAIPFATGDYRALIDSGVDAVVIATPPGLHAPIGLDAIATGKHVLCEKPLATCLADARALRDAAQRAGIVHMLNHQVRFVATFQRAKALVEAGYLGELVVADTWYLGNPVDYLGDAEASASKAGWYTDAAQSGGLLAAAAGPHLVDMLRWLGGPITDVAAHTGVSRALGTVSAEDTFTVVGRYASGGTATLRGIPIGYHGVDSGVALHGTAGSLVIELGRLRGATAADRTLTEIAVPASAVGPQVELARRFIAAIRAGGEAPAPNYADGVAVQAVLDASRMAASTRAWVAVAPSS
jgi:predicted dehydrogenase